MREVRSELAPRFDTSSPALRENPYPAYARFRAAGPLCRGGPAQWVVTRYADVANLLKDHRLGSQFPEEYHRFSLGDGPATEFLRRVILHRDRPDHTVLRRLTGSAFGPGLVRTMHEWIERLVDDLLADARERAQIDAVTDLGYLLPVLVICELLGIPADDRDAIRPRAFDLGKAFSTSVGAADRAAADDAVVWLRDYLDNLLEQRRRRPGDDLLSRMLTAEDDGRRLTHQDIVDNAVFLFFAGFETTTSLIATGSAALLDHPDQLALLRRQPSHIPHAIEEFLRYDAPIQSRLRLVLEPLRIADRTLRPGRVVLLSIGSANHDERQFHDPERLDVTRNPNPHLSFGGGIHYCLGATLARIEATVLFTELIQRFPTIEPAGPAVRQLDGAFRTYSAVPMRLLPR
ncbi:cytochrome P450 [Nocardia brasiliensis]|uniref:cytochrome P450 n=1 Tax=Nocardia brasiliensis TaxID=37326 RepID=UPI0036701B5E